MKKLWFAVLLVAGCAQSPTAVKVYCEVPAGNTIIVSTNPVDTTKLPCYQAVTP